MKYYLLSGMNKENRYNFYNEIGNISNKRLKNYGVKLHKKCLTWSKLQVI